MKDDLVGRLRNWKTRNLSAIGSLIEEAASEIERLRDELSAANSGDRQSVTVTEAARAALERAIASFDASEYPDANRDADTLRSLLASRKEDCEARHE